jgi:hypothetical protein
MARISTKPRDLIDRSAKKFITLRAAMHDAKRSVEASKKAVADSQQLLLRLQGSAEKPVQRSPQRHS